MNIEELTTEQLEAALKKKKAAEKKARELEKKKYESRRDHIANQLMGRAIELNNQLEAFKEACHKYMDEMHLKLEEYGEIRKNSKGGFHITNNNKDVKIIRRRDTNPVWDERSVKAVELLKDFLHDTVKKSAEKEFKILISFLERNKEGDLDYAKVMNLLQHEDNYTDKRWKEGLRLLKESYHVILKSYGYVFKTYQDGQWHPINLNFSSL
jgi:hypothetical protein